MRLIDGDALVYELTELVRYNTGEFKYGIEAARIAAMEAPTIGGWISVKDKQPQKTGLYLTWRRSVYKDGFYRISEYNAEEHGWYDYYNHDFNDTTTRFWMPIPKAPKEDGDHD